jgi:hypothetical protein
VRRLVGSVLVAGILVVPAVSPAAAAAPIRTISSYCSSSGDVCYGIFTRNRVVLLGISTAAHYFSRYTLCVKGPGSGAAGYVRCGSFPVFRQSGATWGSTVRHARQYPALGPGTYRVTWKLNGQALGPTLRFRLPIRR